MQCRHRLKSSIVFRKVFSSLFSVLRESRINAMHSARAQSTLMMRNKGNLVSATCLAVFGVYVISVASKLAYVSEVGPGPGFFPLWLGIGLVSFAACLIFASLAISCESRQGGSDYLENDRESLSGLVGSDACDRASRETRFCSELRVAHDIFHRRFGPSSGSVSRRRRCRSRRCVPVDFRHRPRCFFAHGILGILD